MDNQNNHPVQFAENIDMSILNKPKKPRKAPKAVDNSWKERYAAAHLEWFKLKYPVNYQDGHYCKPNFPKVSTHGGLETAICEYIKFIGGIGVGTATMGVPIFAKDARGNNVLKGYRPGKGKGKSDTDLTYKGIT